MVERSLCMREVLGSILGISSCFFSILRCFASRKIKVRIRYGQRGCSSNGRALALHAIGSRIDTWHLQLLFFNIKMFSSRKKK
ncbi:hypothetical protein C0J52_28216 [Blattella germanica]|nr:hypothetical protein C0J52_28216 [Blattella germanica]